MGKSNILSLFADKVLTVLTSHIPSVLIEPDIIMLTAVSLSSSSVMFFEHGVAVSFVCRPVFDEHYNLLILLRRTDNLCELSIVNEPLRTLSTGGLTFREEGLGILSPFQGNQGQV